MFLIIVFLDLGLRIWRFLIFVWVIFGGVGIKNNKEDNKKFKKFDGEEVKVLILIFLDI